MRYLVTVDGIETYIPASSMTEAVAEMFSRAGDLYDEAFMMNGALEVEVTEASDEHDADIDEENAEDDGLRRSAR